MGSENIAAQLSTDGTAVLVRADQIDKARLSSTAQGPISSGRMGFELFDKPNWSGSDFSEKVNYQRAVEAELERTIQSMNGVDSVRVHLVLPRESIFVDRERPAKASVVLKLRGSRLTEQVAMPVAQSRGQRLGRLDAPKRDRSHNRWASSIARIMAGR